MQVKTNEVVILLIVAFMALAANLPDSATAPLVDRNLLLIALVATVIVSLFRYLKLMLAITVSVLAIGANLPDQLANQLGISQLVMIVASGMLVFTALMYKLSHQKKLAKDQHQAEQHDAPKNDTLNTRNDVITAILNEDVASLHQLLIAGVEVNFSQNGAIPIFLAIEKGYADIVLLLLSHGAKLHVKNKEGKTPGEFATLQEDMHIRVADILNQAAKQNYAVPNKSVSAAPQKHKMVILFADICGSTALYDELGDEVALRVITRTLNILVQEVAMHRGTLVKTIGDEIMCSFPNIALATQAACAMQLAIDTRNPGGDHPIFVRIGFHYGEVIHKAQDVFGDTVNIAARVTSITRARQILTTQSVIELLPAALADKTRPVMRAAFRGKQDSFGVFQILWEPETTLVGRIGQTVFRKPQEDEITFHA